MFGKDLGYTIALVGTVLAFLLHLLNGFYQSKKIKEYKNDERWRLIRTKVDRVTTLYYDFVAGGLGGFCVVAFINHFDRPAMLRNSLMMFFFIFFLKIPIEFIAIRYFDKRM